MFEVFMNRQEEKEIELPVFKEYAIDFKKKRRMYFTAQKFLLEKRYFDYDIRFDAVIFNGRGKTPSRWIRNIIWGDEIGF